MFSIWSSSIYNFIFVLIFLNLLSFKSLPSSHLPKKKKNNNNFKLAVQFINHVGIFCKRDYGIDQNNDKFKNIRTKMKSQKLEDQIENMAKYSDQKCIFA